MAGFSLQPFSRLISPAAETDNNEKKTQIINSMVEYFLCHFIHILQANAKNQPEL
jgi:hypothetical protein